MALLHKHGLPTMIYTTRKLLRDKDVAAGWTASLLLSDPSKKEIPEDLWGYTLANVNHAQGHASLLHRQMNLG